METTVQIAEGSLRDLRLQCETVLRSLDVGQQRKDCGSTTCEVDSQQQHCVDDDHRPHQHIVNDADSTRDEFVMNVTDDSSVVDKDQESLEAESERSSPAAPSSCSSSLTKVTEKVTEEIHVAINNIAVQQQQQLEQLLLTERGNAYACLMELMTVAEQKAYHEKQRLHNLPKETHTSASSSGSVHETVEMELLLVEVALAHLRAEYDEAAAEIVTKVITNDGNAIILQNSYIKTRKMLKTILRILCEIEFVGSQLLLLNAAPFNSNRGKYACHNIKTRDNGLNDISGFGMELSVQEEGEAMEPADTIRNYHKKSTSSTKPAMNDLLQLQQKELVRLKSAIRGDETIVYRALVFVLRTIFFSSVAAAIFLMMNTSYARSMTASFNIFCSPAFPGTGITAQSAVLSAPFWVPTTYLKNMIFENVCTDVPQVQLKIKDQNLVVTEQYWRGSSMNVVVCNYPANKAFVTLGSILTVDSSNKRHKISLPWKTSSFNHGGKENGQRARKRRFCVEQKVIGVDVEPRR